MKTSVKVKGTATSMPKGLLLGLTVGMGLTFVLSAVLTWLTLDGKINPNSTGYYSMGLIVLSSMIGALLSAIRIQRRWMLVCLVNGAVYFVLLLLITAVFFGGRYQGIGVSAILVCIGVLCSGIIGLLKKRSLGRRVDHHWTR